MLRRWNSRPRVRRPRRALKLGLAMLAVLVCIGLDDSGSARAADPKGEFRVFGSGELSCLRWLDDRRLGNESARQSEMWVAGYLTAYNQHVFKQSDVSSHFEGDYLLSWIDDYCRKRGQNSLVIATHELVQMLRRRQ